MAFQNTNQQMGMLIEGENKKPHLSTIEDNGRQPFAMYNTKSSKNAYCVGSHLL
jgi:hypothetical protein